MNQTTPASVAPGVPSLGTIRAAIAARSAPCSGVRLTKDSPAIRASAAASAACTTSGRFTASQDAPSTAPDPSRNPRRPSSVGRPSSLAIALPLPKVSAR